MAKARENVRQGYKLSTDLHGVPTNTYAVQIQMACNGMVNVRKGVALAGALIVGLNMEWKMRGEQIMWKQV